MRTTAKKLVVVAALAACAVPAGAIPITFDISGTITGRRILDSATGQQTTDNSLAGHAFTARFLVETDALRVSQRFEDDYSEFLIIRDAGSTTAVQAFLAIDGSPVDVMRFPVDVSNVQFNDSNGWQETCDELGCFNSIQPDTWHVGVRSGASSPPGGAAERSLFSFTVYEFADPVIPGSGTTWMDFSESASVDLLASLPIEPYIPTSLLRWTEDIGSVSTTTGFNVTSFVRSVNSVPEPGSLALLALGMLGVFASARRREAERG